MIKLYNTLSKQAEGVPKKGRINLYTCGPTVYNYAHVGNLRSYVMADLLYRALKYEGYNPVWAMNITDIDDKTIKGTIEKYGSKATVDDLKEYTGGFYQAFLKDLEEVNVLKDEIAFYRVTEVIPQIQEFILELLDKGYAYRAEDGSTYFSIEKYQRDFGDYGALVGEKFLEGKKTGARVKVDEYEKDNLSDFALWKAHAPEDANIYWDHPVLGKGRPGWHIECSVINKAAFKGEPTDIHTGGVDLIFPHHTNEIAQSQPIYRPFVNLWHHCGHLMVDGKKMAKSLGNIYTLGDLKQKGLAGTDLRYFFLTANMDVQQNLTWEALSSAHTSLTRLKQELAEKPESGAGGFLQAVEDNLNLPKALAALWEQGGPAGFDRVTGILKDAKAEVSEDIKAALGRREEARRQKDFAKSDELRKQIEKMGYEVMDTPEGQKVRKKVSI